MVLGKSMSSGLTSPILETQGLQKKGNLWKIGSPSVAPGLWGWEGHLHREKVQCK